jgi:acylphosphatase
MAERLVCRIFYVRGRVQGVGFRNFVQHSASQIGVSGFTRNLDDGRVEVFAQGNKLQMEELEAQLWRGPRWAEVQHVEKEETTARKLSGFSIRS